MSKLKFKIWDKTNKKWLSSNCGTFILNQYGVLLFNRAGSNILEEVNKVIEYTIVRYTGIKDKHGREIYEGDIIKQTFYKEVGCGSDEISFEGFHLGEVVLIAAGVCIKKPLMYEVEIDQFVKLDGYKNVAAYRSEVIGSIYENPKLLEGN